MIYLYYLISFFGLGVILPFLSVYFVEKTALEASQVTMMMAFVPIVTFFSTNFFAYISDRTRKYKLILVLALMCSIATGLLLGATANVEHIILVIGAYGLFSFFMQTPSQLSENFVLQYSNERNIPYGRLRLFGSLGFAIAGYVGGAITDRFGLQVIFLIFAMCLCAILLMVPRFPDIRDIEQKEEHTEKGIYNRLFANRRFIMIILCSFFILGAMSVMGTFFGIYIIEYAGLDLRFLGLMTLLSAGTEIPMMYFSNKLIDRFGAYRILGLAASLNAIRFITYLLFPVKSFILIVTLFHGIGYGSAFTAIMHLIGKEVPASIRASAISLHATLAMGVGAFILTFLGSAFFNAQTVFAMFAVFELLGLVLCGYLVMKSNKEIIGGTI